jgi:hypothetical protein
MLLLPLLVVAALFNTGSLAKMPPFPPNFKLELNGGEGEASKLGDNKQGANGVVYSIPEWKGKAGGNLIPAVAKTRKDKIGDRMDEEYKNVFEVSYPHIDTVRHYSD